MRCAYFLAGWVLAVAAACGSVSSKSDGGNGDGPPGGGDFSVAVNPTSIVLPIAISETVKVDITRTGGFAGEVTLSAMGLPSGVTAAFATNPVPDGTASTDLTLTVGQGAAPGTGMVTITGTGGGVERSTTLMVELKTITVTGKVVGDSYGNNPSGITVRLVGKSSVVTDASGNFMFTDVTVPYDLYTVGSGGLITSNAIPTVYYYKGLTRPDPTVLVAQQFSLILSTSSSATVNGTRSGAGNNTDPVVILWSNGGTAVTSVNASGGYSHTARWSPSANSNTGTLYGLQFTRATSGAPNGYLGYGSTNTTLTANGTSTVNLTMNAPTTADLTGSITVPAGFPTPTLTLTQQFGNNVALLWTGTTADATAKIPVIAAGKSAFHAKATANNSSTEMVYPALTASTDVSFALPAPPQLMAPVANATGVTTTTQFEYSTTPDTVYRVSMNNSSATYIVFTSGGMVTIPAVSEVPVPANASYSWSVGGFGPHLHVNAAADAMPLEYVNPYDYEGPRHFVTASAARNFTTQ